MKRSANALWKGTIKKGHGNLTTDSKVLKETPYSFNSRFKDSLGTNPEELIAAAHSGCFTMKVSANLSEAGFEPTELKTDCEITMDDGKISASHLVLKADVPGITNDKFEELVEDAKKNCPISVVLNTNISLKYSLKK